MILQGYGTITVRNVYTRDGNKKYISELLGKKITI